MHAATTPLDDEACRFLRLRDAVCNNHAIGVDVEVVRRLAALRAEADGIVAANDSDAFHALCIKVWDTLATLDAIWQAQGVQTVHGHWPAARDLLGR